MPDAWCHGSLVGYCGLCPSEVEQFPPEWRVLGCVIPRTSSYWSRGGEVVASSHNLVVFTILLGLYGRRGGARWRFPRCGKTLKDKLVCTLHTRAVRAPMTTTTNRSWFHSCTSYSEYYCTAGHFVLAFHKKSELQKTKYVPLQRDCPPALLDVY